MWHSAGLLWPAPLTQFHGEVMRAFSCLVLLSFASVAAAQAQAVSVPQVDRGPAVYVPQFQTPAAPGVQQLPESARVVPRPAATRIVQQPIPETFITDADGGPLPDDWGSVSDDAPLSAWSSGEAVPSVGAGVTVILTARSANALPSVGAGAVANQ